MKIVADENIPFVAEGFAPLGEVRTLAGRAITREALRDAEMLVVRSVTRVDKSLLEGTPVRFIGTCTIGFDHVDLGYLASRKIAFASAPGSNATSVAEYIVAVMLQLAHRLNFRLAGKTLGVIGVGNVGGRVARRGEALGMRVLLNDPPFARKTGDRKFRPLDEVLSQSDIVTLHVPLEKGGDDPTWHMVDDAFLARLKPGAILFNSSRGGVQDECALVAAKRSGRLAGLFLDVWENEPNVNVELLKAADLASPHICGYSADGKVAGVVMVQHAAGEFFGVKSDWDPTGQLPAPMLPKVTLKESSVPDEEVLRRVVLATYDFEGDDRRMREMLTLAPDPRAKHFDALRKTYPCRREFRNTEVMLEGGCRKLATFLTGVGFSVIS